MRVKSVTILGTQTAIATLVNSVSWQLLHAPQETRRRGRTDVRFVVFQRAAKMLAEAARHLRSLIIFHASRPRPD